MINHPSKAFSFLEICSDLSELRDELKRCETSFTRMQAPDGWSGLNVIKLFSYSLQLSMPLSMLTNVRMITIVGILTVLAV